ncbi:MAG: hypothetical protein V1859_09695 [archaeon]
MRTKHIFVSVVDVSEVIPFCLKDTTNLSESLTEQTKSREKLEEFIALLQKTYKQKIWYMGFDIIGEKSYERFMFDDGGFLEIMMEAPLAINAHFVHREQAEKFCTSLKKTFLKILKDDTFTKMFVDSISVNEEKAPDEEINTLTVKKWHTLQNIRGK